MLPGKLAARSLPGESPGEGMGWMERDGSDRNGRRGTERNGEERKGKEWNDRAERRFPGKYTGRLSGGG